MGGYIVADRPTIFRFQLISNNRPGIRVARIGDRLVGVLRPANAFLIAFSNDPPKIEMTRTIAHPACPSRRSMSGLLAHPWCANVQIESTAGAPPTLPDSERVEPFVDISGLFAAKCPQ
jgi:hypothetical protein